MHRLIPIQKPEDIPASYQDTPIGLLLEYHNFGKKGDTYENAELLIGMCMDHRNHLDIPDNFAYIIRAGGANLKAREFKVSYAIGVGGVRYLALIGHTQCGMVNIEDRRELFISGLVQNAGWNARDAEHHFDQLAPQYEINNEIDFVIEEVDRFRKQYPKIIVASMMFKVEDNLLYLVDEK